MRVHWHDRLPQCSCHAGSASSPYRESCTHEGRASTLMTAPLPLRPVCRVCTMSCIVEQARSITLSAPMLAPVTVPTTIYMPVALKLIPALTNLWAMLLVRLPVLVHTTQPRLAGRHHPPCPSPPCSSRCSLHPVLCRMGRLPMLAATCRMLACCQCTLHCRSYGRAALCAR